MRRALDRRPKKLFAVQATALRHDERGRLLKPLFAQNSEQQAIRGYVAKFLWYLVHCSACQSPFFYVSFVMAFRRASGFWKLDLCPGGGLLARLLFSRL